MQEESYSFRKVIGDTSVEDLGLSNRSANALRRNGVTSLSQLLEKTEEDLLSLRNLGVKSVRELLAIQAFYRAEFGLSAQQNAIPVSDPAPKKPDVIRFLNTNGVWCDDIPIDALELSVRSFNCLRRGGYEFASQLIAVTREDLLKIENMGAKSADEILAVVQGIQFRAAEEATDDPIAVPDAASQKDRMTDFCREVYEGIGVAPKMLYGALEKLAADGASLTGESLYYRAYDLPFMKAALKERIYSHLYEEEFDPVSREAIDRKLPAHLFNTTITDEALIDLENEGRIRETDDGYACRYPRCTEFAASIENENERFCLLERLKGRTLEEIGQELKLTRERVRQMIEKALNRRGRPRLHEDRYGYFFDTYYIQKEYYCSAFREPPEAYEYLVLTVKKKTEAKADIETALYDPKLPEKWKRRLHKLIYRNYVFLDGQPVKIDRQTLVMYAIRKFAQEKLPYEDFTARYVTWLEELGFGDREDLRYNERSYENKISLLDCVLWNFKSSFRYYDISAVDADAFFKAINLPQFRDLSISTLLIFRSCPEVMEDYDIRDEYELHNLIRKLDAQSRFPELQIDYKKMPSLVFGNGNPESQALELLLEMAPVSYEEFSLQFELRYGQKKEYIGGFLLKWFSEYYEKGIFRIDTVGFDLWEVRKMKNELTDDFYLKKEIVRIYLRFFPEGDVKRINTYSLKNLGFHVYESYVVSERFRSASDYFDHLLLDQPITDMTDRDARFSAITAYSSELLKLRAERRIVEFAPKQYITIERLNECGITLADIERYCADIAALVDEGEFFTLKSLRAQGFSDELDDFGFDDWFYMSLLCEDKAHFNYRRIANSRLFRKGTGDVRLTDFLQAILLREQSIDIFDLLDLLEGHYGLHIDLTKIKAVIRESELYYDDIMEKVYIDYDTYYEEV